MYMTKTTQYYKQFISDSVYVHRSTMAQWPVQVWLICRMFAILLIRMQPVY